MAFGPADAACSGLKSTSGMVQRSKAGSQQQQQQEKTNKREVIVIFRRSERPTYFPPHANGEAAQKPEPSVSKVLELDAARSTKNHSNTEGSSELLSPLTVSPGERWPAASLCGWTADAFRGWSNLTARSLRAPLPGIASAFTSGCQCSEGSPTQLSEQRPALRTKILGPSTDGLRGPTAGFYLLKAFRLNRVLQSILLPIQWHGVWLTTKTQMYATADMPRI